MEDRLLYRAVERILSDAGALSRNRNFAAFEDARMRRAMRIARYLRALRMDLRRWASQSEVRLLRQIGADEAASVQLEIAGLWGRRVAYLTPEELRLLCLDPEVEALLGDVAQQAG